MKLNQKILHQFKHSQSKLLVVSKYFSVSETNALVTALEKKDFVVGFGENRPQSLLDKKIDQKKCHFIGNIQSKKIPIIANHCSVIHSLCHLKHAHILAEQRHTPHCFIQINISEETQKGGVKISEIEPFLSALPPNFPVAGISAIGAYNDDPFLKKQEFQTLIDLRKQLKNSAKKWPHLSLLNWHISAGTSIDYEFALEHGIDLIRVGRALFQS